MAGIYIHIPFCASKCAYCGFYSIPSQKLKIEFLEALKSEIVERKDYLHGESISTIYFGGGTPSLLSAKEISDLLMLIKDHYEIEANPEITLEANPDTLSIDYLSALRKLGINRLSIGIQSFFDNDLKYLSRRHNAEHACQCIGWAKQAGFDNLNLDLIYGLPTSDTDQWNRNLDIFFQTGAQHLSAYALTLEPNSILTKQIETGKALPVSDDDAVRDYEILCRRAKENGFLHYEISNFCQPRHASRHNSSYWNRTPYAGFGPSAHSFDGESRQWNVSSVGQYIESGKWRVESGKVESGRDVDSSRLDTQPHSQQITKEILTPEQAYDEYVMLKLRTAWGIDLKYMKREMGERFSNYCEQKAQPFVAQGKITQTREFLHLNDEQMLFADGLAEELFWE